MPIFALFRGNPERIFLIGALCAATMALGAAPVQVSDNYSFALMFLKCSYPQVVEQQLLALIAPHFAFSLNRAPQPLTTFALIVQHGPPDHTVSAELGPVVFRATFEFDAKHRLQRFLNAGNDFVSTARVDALEDLFRDHPDWRLEEKAAAVRMAGAKFGPLDEARMLSEVRTRLAALKGLLGGTRISWYKFIYEGAAYWRIEAKTLRAPHTVYQLMFEPFEGRLVAFSRE